VLKLWQARDPFDPESLFQKIRGGAYDWTDVQRLVRASERIEPAQIISTIEARFGILRQLTELERRVISGASRGRNERLADRLRVTIVELAAG